jgi:hypothetical protein
MVILINRGNGRVRPEAADIAMMHKRGTVGHLLTNPLLPPKQLKCMLLYEYLLIIVPKYYF